MKRKSILVAIILVAISIVGCGNNPSGMRNNTTGNPDTGNNATGNTDWNNYSGNNATGNTDWWNNSSGNNAKDNTNNDAVESIKDNAQAAGNALKYTATNFRDDVINAGYELKDSINSNKNYFTGSETDYMMGNDIVRVYEYNSVADLQKDINKIAPNGLTINGTDANYTRKPYYYSKGNSLIVYEGNEPAYVDEFKTMYGNTIIP